MRSTGSLIPDFAMHRYMYAMRVVSMLTLWMTSTFGSGRCAMASGSYEFRLPDTPSVTGVPASPSASHPVADRSETASPSWTLQASSADADEVAALNLLKRAQEVLLRADQARDEDRMTEAARMYETALILYNRLAAEYPGWQAGLVKFRQAYCEVKVGELSQRKEGDPGWQAGAWQIGPPAPPTNVQESVSRPDAHAGPESKSELTPILAKAREFLETGKPDEAIKALLQGLRIDPDHATLRLMVGLAQCQAGKFEDALFVLNPLVLEHPMNASAHLALGTAYFGLDRIEAARLALEQALILDPGLHAAHYNLAQILLGQKPPDREGAQRHYREALRLGAERDRELEGRL